LEWSAGAMMASGSPSQFPWCRWSLMAWSPMTSASQTRRSATFLQCYHWALEVILLSPMSTPPSIPCCGAANGNP
jgi:hypothetical protein